MCCHPLPAAKRWLRKQNANKKWIKCWKTLHSNGRSLFAFFQYQPGTHQCGRKKYNPQKPHGFHVWLDIPSPHEVFNNTLLPVYGDLASLVCTGYDQAVFSRILIKRKDWIDAGLSWPLRSGMEP